jgi:hypothetical protein
VSLSSIDAGPRWEMVGRGSDAGEVIDDVTALKISTVFACESPVGVIDKVVDAVGIEPTTSRLRVEPPRYQFPNVYAAKR